jgi:hypothetical protein
MQRLGRPAGQTRGKEQEGYKIHASRLTANSFYSQRVHGIMCVDVQLMQRLKGNFFKAGKYAGHTIHAETKGKQFRASEYMGYAGHTIHAETKGKQFRASEYMG